MRLDRTRVAGSVDAAEHLSFELARLELRLERQVLRLRAAQVLNEDPFRGLYIADSQVDALLTDSGKAPPATGVEALGLRLGKLDQERAERLDASREAGVKLPLLHLADIFDLDSLEQEAILIALAPEVDRRYETLYAYVQNDVTRKRPTVGLVLDLLCDGLAERLEARSRFAPEGQLRRQRLAGLVEDSQESQPSLLSRYLKLEDRVVDHLLGGTSLDENLTSFCERLATATANTDLSLDPEVFSQLSRAFEIVAHGGFLMLQGPLGAGKREAAAALCHEAGRPLLAADLARTPTADGSLLSALALLRREALLTGAGLLLEHLEVLTSDEARKSAYLAVLGRELDSPSFPVFLASEEPWEPAGLWPNSPFSSFALPRSPPVLRRQLWQRALADADGKAVAEEDLADVAGKFVLTPGQIRAAGRRAVHMAATRNGTSGTVASEDLHAGARALSGQGLARLAQKVETSYSWDDIVLPRRAHRQLEEVFTSVEYRARVYSDWGFEAKLALGKGTNVLFAGPSGTGKTMAASILARELGLDLYKIDLANVVSKYIGETEKNLSRVFDEAQTSNAILFFDEADALFGKRSEVKDSHDRYANIETAYLLQRMEEYEGVSILATNLRKSLDEAFARRLQHTVEFPFPDAIYRERIWKRIFPPSAPLAEDADFGFLAQQFELTGGNIKNVALAAAFLAAENGGVIGMEQLICATSRELQKIGRLPTRGDFGQYYELIRERR